MKTRGVRLEELPGHELVAKGIEDLRQGRRTPEALLVRIGAFPEHELYDLLVAHDPDSAHGRYNSLVRRLVSFERALARAHSR